MLYSDREPTSEDLAFPTASEQLEIVVLLKEGKIRTFRDVLPYFGGSIEAAAHALGELDEWGSTVPSEGDGEDYLDEAVTFTDAGRAVADGITVTHEANGQRRIELLGADGTHYTVLRSSDEAAGS